MPRALKPLGGEFTHVLECDRELPEHEQTVWTLKPLTFGQREAIRDLRAQRVQSDGDAAQFRFSENRVHLQMLDFGLVRAKNFRGDDGQEIAVERDRGGELLEEFLSRLEDSWVTELAETIWDRSTLSESDQKNS